MSIADYLQLFYCYADLPTYLFFNLFLISSIDFTHGYLISDSWLPKNYQEWIPVH